MASSGSRSKRLSVFAAGLICFLVGSHAFAELLGRGPVDPLLQSLIEPLHEQKIDVVAGETKDLPPTLRPRVALLSGMSVPPADYGHAPWIDDFVSGARGFVLGAQAQGTPAMTINEQQFLSIWNTTPREKRVFLSFNSADADAAHKTAKALNDAGYHTFVFLNEKSGTPKYSGAFTGRIFADAGHYIVLDTANARASRGVWLERAALTLLVRSATGGGPSPDGPTGTGHPGPDNPQAPGGAPANTSSFDQAAFRDGVLHTWVVTENPNTPGKLFIHRELIGNSLVDLLYYVKVQPDGSWVVYDPNGPGHWDSAASRLGSLTRPKGAHVGRCTCE
jgi:hypothetical protein